MHRYSKALKRRALWDREKGVGVSSWHYRGCRMGRNISSTDPGRAKIEEGEHSKRKDGEDWREVHKDFESFKAAVDRAIERDPYGTLFGRRLRSPDSTTSSWTSWSWIFDPKEIKEDPTPEPEEKEQKYQSTAQPKDGDRRHVPAAPNLTTSESQPIISHSSSSSKTGTTLSSSQSIIYADPPSHQAAGEYVYDPITGRKVLQSSPLQPTTPKQKPGNANTEKTGEPVIQPLSTGGFLRSLFATEHGVNIPVKTYKPAKVYGYTGEAEAPPKPENKVTESTTTTKKRFESSRKREYNQLRALTLGNSIDTTAEFGGKFVAEPVEATNVVSKESEEKRVRTSPAPSEDTPLFCGTTYASRSDSPKQPSNDWLSKEGFRARQGMTMPSLKTNRTSQMGSSEPTERLETALDRTSSTTGTDIPVKKFTPKLQPSIDRVVSPSTKLESTPAKAIPMPAPKTEPVEDVGHDTREEVDRLRPSDVRAAAKAARETKQAAESKRKDRADLEKDFGMRQAEEQNATGLGAKILAYAPSATSSLSTIWKHVKEYPSGIVAKTMQNIGLAQSSQKEPKTSVATPNRTASEDTQLLGLALKLKGILDEHQSKPESIMEQERPLKAAPAFSEPTVKPGVIRNLEVERHTKEFEPKLANIVDRAKAIKRELHDVSLSIENVVNERAITAIADRHLIQNKQEPVAITTIEEASPAAPKESAPHPQATSSVATSVGTSYDSPFILLMYNKATDDVEVTSLKNLMGSSSASEAKLNPMAAIGSLNHPNAFVKHFVQLDKNGYELKSGGGDVLVFQKQQAEPIAATSSAAPASNLSASPEFRSTIAAAEAAAQPPPSTSKSVSEPLKAANVLDNIPVSIPLPGPAAPTAPPASSSNTEKSPAPPTVVPLASISQPQPTQSPPSASQSIPVPKPVSQTQAQPTSRARKSRSQVRRQEEVFSGQQRLPPQTTSLPDVTHFQKHNPGTASNSQSTAELQPSLFARLSRAVRRVILTALAFGAGAYGIGVIAEGIASKAQIEGRADGPMKRLVLESEEGRRKGDRQRAGIFSTESSR